MGAKNAENRGAEQRRRSDKDTGAGFVEESHGGRLSMRLDEREALAARINC